MENSVLKNLLSRLDLIVMAIILLAFIFLLAFPSFRAPSTVTLQFNASEYRDIQINGTSLAVLQFECIKFCSGKFYDNYQKLQLCYKECQRLSQDV